MPASELALVSYSQLLSSAIYATGTRGWLMARGGCRQMSQLDELSQQLGAALRNWRKRSKAV